MSQDYVATFMLLDSHSVYFWVYRWIISCERDITLPMLDVRPLNNYQKFLTGLSLFKLLFYMFKNSSQDVLPNPHYRLEVGINDQLIIVCMCVFECVQVEKWKDVFFSEVVFLTTLNIPFTQKCFLKVIFKLLVSGYSLESRDSNCSDTATMRNVK